MSTVIIGSGLAALTCALSLGKQEEVVILTKGRVNDSNSALAQGGIAASSTKLEDIKSHVEDTLVAGNQQNNQQIVQKMIENSASAIDFLKEHGVEFDTVNQQIHLTREGGHKKRRILHVGGDQSGKKIIEQLLIQVNKRENISIIENARALEFVNKNLRYLQGNDINEITADQYVIACGGATGVFSATTAIKQNSGDFISLAQSAGLELSDLHLVQFHPTCFQQVGSKRGFLISEAVRGEGAYLVDETGKRFMQQVHTMAELAPRDIVAREIWQKHVTNQQVYIDARHLSKELIATRFIQINQFLKEQKLDLGEDLIPITPAAHYQLGGITSNLSGQTNVENIYAIGESACTGFHGSNRLASNSLLECIVMARSCAEQISQQNKHNQVKNKKYKNVDPQTNDVFEVDSKQITDKLSIIRQRKELLDLQEQLKIKKEQLKQHKEYNHEWFDKFNVVSFTLEACNASLTHQSSGCHFIKENNE